MWLTIPELSSPLIGEGYSINQALTVKLSYIYMVYALHMSAHMEHTG